MAREVAVGANRLHAMLEPILDDAGVRGARFRQLGRQSVDRIVPLVADHELRLRIEHAEPFRYIAHCGFETNHVPPLLRGGWGERRRSSHPRLLRDRTRYTRR